MKALKAVLIFKLLYLFLRLAAAIWLGVFLNGKGSYILDIKLADVTVGGVLLAAILIGFIFSPFEKEAKEA